MQVNTLAKSLLQAFRNFSPGFKVYQSLAPPGDQGRSDTMLHNFPTQT